MLDIRNPSVSLSLLGVSDTLYPEGRPQAVKAALDQFFTAPFEYVYYPRSGLQPPWILALSEGTLYVWSSGVHNLEQGLGVLLSSSAKLAPVGDGRAGSLYVLSGRNVFNTIVSKYGGSVQGAVLVGHSYGGALLSVTAKLLKDQVGDNRVQLVTFGAPRTGDDAFVAELQGVDVVRWMCAADPVPRFPPRWDEAPALTLALGFEIARAWSLYGQSHGGVVLYANGTMGSALLPPLSWPIQDAKLLAWATGGGGFLAAEHTLAFYRARLTAVAAANAPFAGPGVAGGPTEAIKPLSPAVFSALTGGVFAAAEAAALSEGSKMAYIPKPYRFQPFKLGDGWVVTWCQFVIGTSRSVGGAKAFCREGNRWLRVMQSQNSISQDRFMLALQAYLAVASSTSQGFEPPLLVTLPV